MNKNNFDELRGYFEKHTSEIEVALRENMPEGPTEITSAYGETVEKALFTGGTRIRPVLTLLGAEIVGGIPSEVVPASAIAEYIQCASSIYEGFPWFGNGSLDDCSVSAADSVSIVVAQAFLNASYPLVFVNHSGTPENSIQAHAEIVECIGGSGMIGGFELNSASVEAGDAVDRTENLRRYKDMREAALMRLALRIGAILSGANYIELEGLSRFAEHFGDSTRLKSALQRTDGADEASVRNDLRQSVESAKSVLVEDFDSSDARSCLIQLSDFLMIEK